MAIYEPPDYKNVLPGNVWEGHADLHREIAAMGLTNDQLI